MLAYLFVVLAAVVHVRWIALPFSFTPVLAALLYFGARMPRKQIWIPLAALAASDLYLNRFVYGLAFNADQIITWGFYAAVLLGASYAIKGWSPVRIGVSALGASVGFFIVSNFAVWLAGTMYPMTASGLGTCFVAGLPFYRNQLVSDMLFTAAFFGVGYAVSLRHTHELATVAVPRTR
jgi:uncharacterized protein DUF6580